MIGLIGLGAIGVPIAHKISKAYPEDFCLVLNINRKKKFEESDLSINNEVFNPIIITEKCHYHLDILIVCVKNYDLDAALSDIKKVIDNDTIILPLQNGIYSATFFKKHFPYNIVLEGYVQGPNTIRQGNSFVYSNAGSLHFGTSCFDFKQSAKKVYEILEDAELDVTLEDNIQKMVWKKWMLNVAGNSITALTGADYSLFKLYSDLQGLCRLAMEEFLVIAHAENVQLDEKDIEDIIEYYVTYIGSKKTSMLMDVFYERKTENKYLAGMALQIGNEHGLTLPVISTLYYLVEIKEEVYMERNGCRAMKNLFTDGIEYSDALRVQMNDICRKMEDEEYASIIRNGEMPERLLYLLKYASDNTSFYSKYSGATNIEAFPVMNKTLLNEHYEEVVVHAFDNTKTHKMYTSGSTGIPFMVVQNLAKRERHIADLKYFGALAGYVDHDPMCYLRAKPTATPEEQERDNIWQLDICNLSEKNLTDYYHVMVEKKCTALIAYPSTLETAVDFWSKSFVNNSSIKTIISTSETLTDEVKNKLKHFFGDEVGIYARYSNTEQGILGQETGISNSYKLNWASYYFEILKFDSDEKAEDGELGRIVVTDLYNEAFPLIRYDTGDVARMDRRGNGLPEFIELYGRRMDLIYDLNGEVVSPFLLCRTMRLSSGIEQWQFIQESVDTYTLKITSNSEKRPNVDKEVLGFRQTLGENAIINVEYVEDIPVMNSLKRKLIVSNLKK